MAKVKQCACGTTYNPDEVTCCPRCGGTGKIERPRGKRGKTLRGGSIEAEIRRRLKKGESVQSVLPSMKGKVRKSSVYNIRKALRLEEEEPMLGRLAIDEIEGWAVNPITCDLVAGGGVATEDGSKPLDEFDGEIVDCLLASLRPSNPEFHTKIHELILRFRVLDKEAPDQLCFYSLGSGHYKFSEPGEMTIGGVKIKGWYQIESFRA